MDPTRRFSIAAIVCLAGLAVAVGMQPLTNNDIWLHLTTGRTILERGSIPHVDEYSFTRFGGPYVAHEWVAQVLFWCLYRVAGIDGLILFKPLALMITALLLRRAARELGAGPIASLWGAVLAIISMTSHLFVRPHLFTFMMLAAVSLLLVRIRQDNRLSVALFAALELLWANLHGGFILGIALALSGLSFPAAALAAAASLVNPNGPGLYRFVLVFADPVFRRRIREWATPFSEPFLGSFPFWFYVLTLLLVAAAIVHHGRRRRWHAVGPLLVFMLLSFTSKRNVSLLGIVAAPWLALAATELRVRASAARHRPPVPAMTVSCIGIGALVMAAILFGVPHETGRARRAGLGLGENVPVTALDYATQRDLSGNVLNSLGFGSYITWRSWPQTRVFIDSRLDVYGGPFVEQYSLAMSNPALMKELMGKYRLDYAVISYRLEDGAGAVAALSADPGWALVHYDDIAMVYVKKQDRWSAVIEQDAYRYTNPATFLSGDLAFSGHPQEALAETTRALVRSPDSSLILLMHGTALAALGRHREAVASLEQAASHLAPDAGGRDLLMGMLGTSYMELHDDAQAERAFEQQLRFAPGSVYARKMLEEIRARRRPD